MAPPSLRRLALAGMVALLVGGAPLAQTPEPAHDDSIEVIRTRANTGDAEAQVRLAALYSFGVGGAPQDYRAAAVWRRKAAEQGHATAQYLLGAAYRRGEGVPQDAVEAVAWTRQAAEPGGTSIYEGYLKKQCPDLLLPARNGPEWKAWYDQIINHDLRKYHLWTIVRNPYDRFLSLAGMLKVAPKHLATNLDRIRGSRGRVYRHSHEQWKYTHYETGEPFMIHSFEYVKRLERLSPSFLI